MDWELTDADALLEGSTLSSIKNLVDEYPEDKAISKKTKKTDTGKDKTGKNNDKKL